MQQTPTHTDQRPDINTDQRSDTNTDVLVSDDPRLWDNTNLDAEDTSTDQRSDTNIDQRSDTARSLEDILEFKSNQTLNSTLYREIPRNLIFSISTSWPNSPHHSGFRFAFLSPFRVSSSRERAVPTQMCCCQMIQDCETTQTWMQKTPTQSSHRVSECSLSHRVSLCVRACVRASRTKDKLESCLRVLS